MSRSKFLILFSLVLLMAGMAGVVQAQERPRGTGNAVISDGLGASDRATFSLSNVIQPAEGFVLEGWLVSDDGATKLSTGILRVTNGVVNHRYDSPEQENLIANYNKAVITVEPAQDDDPEPSDDVRHSDGIPPGAMTHIRHLIVSFPEDEDNGGIVANLQLQLDTAIQHSQLARSSDNIDDLRNHTHHVINIIEGSGGANYDDSFGDPGDGYGVLNHAADAAAHAQLAINAAPGDDTLVDNADLVISSSTNVQSWSGEARDMAVDLLSEDRLNIAKTLLNTIEGRLSAGRNGISATNSGGAEQAYDQAQDMATYVFPGRSASAGGGGSQFVFFPVVGDPTIPAIAQFAMIGSIILLASGLFLMVKDRRSRRRI